MTHRIPEISSQRILDGKQSDASIDAIVYATGECALGHVLVARSVKGVRAVLIGACREELEKDLAFRFPGAKLVGGDDAVRDDLAKVSRFVEKPADGLDFPLDMRVRRFNSGFGRDFVRSRWEGQ